MNAARYVLALASLLLAAHAASAEPARDRNTIERGRYLVMIGGCNDCHTPGYAENAGQVPQAAWLTGTPVGFRGPWGTTYPANLRLLVQTMTENHWVAHARKPLRPPMPWFNLRDMTDTDLRSMYRFIRSLGPAGKLAPAYAPPGSAVATPFIDFVPKQLPTERAAK